MKLLENFRLSIELSEPNSYIYFRIAKCYKKINNKKLFLDYIKNSVREEPGNEKAWIYLIKYYLKNNNLRQAKYLASKALNNNHNSIKIIELNAIINRDTGDISEALNFIIKLLNLKKIYHGKYGRV